MNALVSSYQSELDRILLEELGNFRDRFRLRRGIETVVTIAALRLLQQGDTSKFLRYEGPLEETAAGVMVEAARRDAAREGGAV